MELNIDANAAAQRSAFVAPTLGGAQGELCSKARFRGADVYTQVTFTATGDAGMATGHRTWRQLIT